MLCLILSIVAISTCKFAQVKADSYKDFSSYKVKYDIFSQYDNSKGEYKTYDDYDGYDTSSQQKWAQSLAIITILVLTSSIICVSVLLFCTFSPKIKKLNQILLIIALVTSYTPLPLYCIGSHLMMLLKRRVMNEMMTTTFLQEKAHILFLANNAGESSATIVVIC